MAENPQEREVRLRTVRGVLDLMAHSSRPCDEWPEDTIAPFSNGHALWFVGRENYFDGDFTQPMAGTAPLDAEAILKRIEARESKADDSASERQRLGGGDRLIITIREATDEERREGTPPLVAGGKRCSVPKYVCVGPNDRLWLTFFMPTGGETREEAVFWAERAASKNGLRYVAPEGWENVEGSLPDGG